MSQDLIYGFEILGKGMLSIFIVMAILMIVSTLLSKITKKKNEDSLES